MHESRNEAIAEVSRLNRLWLIRTKTGNAAASIFSLTVLRSAE